jgi:hypothetical protein
MPKESQMSWKPGTKLRSAADSTEVIVIRAPNEDVDLRCGGYPMVTARENDGDLPALDPEFAKGTQLGKRYINEPADLELLCTKAGDGSLSVGTAVLSAKGAKPLPASD